MWERRDFLAKLGLGLIGAFTLRPRTPALAAASRTILTITGRIQSSPIELSFADLEALEQKTITTETPWYLGKKTFRGPRMRALLDAVGAEGASLVVHALNDYQATIPVSEARDYDIVLATHMNAEPMSIREKGPLFVIYPFDDRPALRTEQVYARCVWQVKRIDVV